MFMFSSRRRHTRSLRDWSSDVCSSDLSIAGSHTILANVDDINRFPEGNENNNTLSKSFSVYTRSYAINSGGAAIGGFSADRSEERRVGEECSAALAAVHQRKNRKLNVT